MTETTAPLVHRPRLQPHAVQSQQSLTDYIRALRAMTGDTGAALAGVLGMAASTYAAKESGSRRLHIDEAARILNFYGYTLAVIEIPQDGR